MQLSAHIAATDQVNNPDHDREARKNWGQAQRHPLAGVASGPLTS